MDADHKRYAVLALGIAAVSWASIFVKLCDAPPIIIASYRMGLASLFLLPIVLLKFRGELAAIERREFFTCAGAGIFLGLHFILWITSLEYTSVASSVVLVTTNPIFVALIGFFILGEGVGRRLLTSIALIVVGGALIGMADISAGSGGLKGDVLALLGSLMMSLYLIIGRRVRQRMVLIPYIFLAYGTASLCLIGVSVVMGLPFVGYSPSSYTMFLLLALVPTLVGHTSFNWALRHMTAAVVAVTILGEPVGATLLAYLVLHEIPGPIQVAGAALILWGIYHSLSGERKAPIPLDKGGGG